MSLLVPFGAPPRLRAAGPPRRPRTATISALTAPVPGAPLPGAVPGRLLALPRGGTGNRPGSADPEAAAAPTAASARLLIVEDDWFIALEIEAVAQAAGHDVIGLVATADEAVELALARRPDLVLMDIRLAGPRDGIEAAIELRERADIPSLFVSAHQDPAIRAKAAPARPAGWLSKPFTEPQLNDAVTRALTRPGTG